jgi:hypothetical protein
MESVNSKINSLSQLRFSSFIFLLRLGGIPFQMKKMSTIYAIYKETLFFCLSATYIGMLFDVYMHRNDLGNAMASIRVLISFTNIMWIYTYCRYVRKQPFLLQQHSYLSKIVL